MLFVPIAVFWLLAVDNFSILIVLGLGFTVPLFEGISIDTSFTLFLWIITLIHLILKLPLMVRRLGDLGLSWLYIFFSIVPLFHYGLTIMMFFRGMDEDNEFGPGYGASKK